jgi:hypothetical protein
MYTSGRCVDGGCSPSLMRPLVADVRTAGGRYGRRHPEHDEPALRLRCADPRGAVRDVAAEYSRHVVELADAGLEPERWKEIREHGKPGAADEQRRACIHGLPNQRHGLEERAVLAGGLEPHPAELMLHIGTRHEVSLGTGRTSHH